MWKAFLGWHKMPREWLEGKYSQVPCNAHQPGAMVAIAPQAALC